MSNEAIEVLRRAQIELKNAPHEGLPKERHNIPIVTAMTMPDGAMVRIRAVVPFDATPQQILACELRQHEQLRAIYDLEVFKQLS